VPEPAVRLLLLLLSCSSLDSFGLWLSPCTALHATFAQQLDTNHHHALDTGSLLSTVLKLHWILEYHLYLHDNSSECRSALQRVDCFWLCLSLLPAPSLVLGKELRLPGSSTFALVLLLRGTCLLATYTPSCWTTRITAAVYLLSVDFSLLLLMVVRH